MNNAEYSFVISILTSLLNINILVFNQSENVTSEVE